jgi:hypothetical protein
MVLMDEGGTLTMNRLSRPAAVPTVITIVLPEELAMDNSVVLRAAINFACDMLAFATVEIKVCDQTPAIVRQSDPTAGTVSGSAQAHGSVTAPYASPKPRRFGTVTEPCSKKHLARHPR